MTENNEGREMTTWMDDGWEIGATVQRVPESRYWERRRRYWAAKDRRAGVTVRRYGYPLGVITSIERSVLTVTA